MPRSRSSAKTPGHRAAADQLRAPALRPVGNCDRLRSYLRRHRDAIVTVGGIGVASGATADSAAESEAAPQALGGSPTNVQEEGVDEPDIVKASGSTVFSVDGTTLRAIDASAPAPVLSGSVRLPRGPGEGGSIAGYELLVAGDRLLAIGTSYGYGPVQTDVIAPDVAYAGEPRSVIAVVDISDPAAMRVTQTMTVEGSYVSGRLTGSTARLVSSSYAPATIPQRGHGRALLPAVTVRDRVSGARSRHKLVGCGDVSRPSRFAGAGMLSVLTIDLERGLPAIDVDSVLTDGEVVYASASSLYVATERWSDGADTDGSEVDTQIHRFDISDPRSTDYVASGRVSGYMLGQWSMSEHEGVLRVASTTSPPWLADGSQQGESESYVTELVTDGDRLRSVGRVGGIGRGEDIYAVRLIGDSGYVVTFRQVDPLYVLDLSDPTAPRAVGELKVPGYSAYLHPVGPGLLLGVGREVSADGVPGGVQASLFDVSDPASPVRLDREGFGGGSSTEVEYDHHAFSWVDDAGLALLPIDSYMYGSAGERHSLAGLRVAPGGGDPLGRVAKPGFGGGVRRTLELGGRIYAVGPRGIGSYDPSTMAPLARLDY